MHSSEEKLLYDYESAAEVSSLTRAALRDLVYRGRGPRITRIGRRTFFARRDLEDFIEAHREPASSPCPLPPQPKRRKRGRPTIAEQMERLQS